MWAVQALLRKITQFQFPAVSPVSYSSPPLQAPALAAAPVIMSLAGEKPPLAPHVYLPFSGSPPVLRNCSFGQGVAVDDLCFFRSSSLARLCPLHEVDQILEIQSCWLFQVTGYVYVTGSGQKLPSCLVGSMYCRLGFWMRWVFNFFLHMRFPSHWLLPAPSSAFPPCHFG